MASEAELALILSAIDKGFAGTLNKAEKEVGGFGKTIGDVGKIASGFLAANVIQQGVGALTSGIGSSINAASNLGESINAVKVTFGAASQEILDWGKANSTSLGLSQRAFNELATPLGALLQNVGFGADEAGDKTRELTTRAADMASVFNVDVSEALGAIQAGLKGEADPLERFGVGLSAAKVEAEALTMTGKSSAKALTDQEKAAARLNIIFKETAKTAGDFSNTSDGLANRQRILQARIENLQAKFGAFAAEAKAAVLGVLLNQVLPGVERFGTVMSKVIGPPVTKAASAIKSFIGALRGGSSSADSFGTKMVTVAGPLDKLAGIIRTVVPQALAFLREKFAELSAYFESDIKPALENIKTAVVAVATFILENWQKLMPVIKPIMDQIVLAIETAVGIIGNTIAIFIDLLQGDFSGAWKNFQDLIRVVWDYIVGTIGNALELIKGGIQLGMEGIVALLGLAWDGIKLGFAALWDGIKATAAAAWGGILDVLRANVNLAIGLINGLIRSWNGLEFSMSDPSGVLGKLGLPDKVSVGTPKLPEVPYLAEGGIVTGPMLAVVGDNRSRREAIIPLEEGMGLGPNITVHVHGSILSERDIVRIIRDEYLRGGFRGVT